jgi:hypothetical protein
MLHGTVRAARVTSRARGERVSGLGRWWLLVLLLALIPCSPAPAAEKLLKYDPPGEDLAKKRFLVLPFPYYNESIGAGAGVAAISQGYVQKQMLTIASAMASDQGTNMFFIMVRNARAPFLSRLILEPQVCQNKFKDVQSYVISNPAFPDEQPAGNDSSENNFLNAEGNDFWVDFKMRYLLPLGAARDSAFVLPRLDDGVPLAADAARAWNPMANGRTCVEVTPFYRSRRMTDDLDHDITQKTAGMDFALTYDNTDYWPNPSTGSYQSVFCSRDWGGLGSSAPWTVVGLDVNKYISLGDSEYARQRVIALNFWTVDCLTWDDHETEDGGVVYHRPPSYKGGNLGGLWRLRGYPASRFNDQAAIYYCAEYRYTLAYNPLKDFTMNGRLDVDWFQLVGFAELGRVAPAWSPDLLHTDMKWSLGAGLRTEVNLIIIRADLGVSEETAIVQLFIGHPF